MVAFYDFIIGFMFLTRTYFLEVMDLVSGFSYIFFSINW